MIGLCELPPRACFCSPKNVYPRECPWRMWPTSGRVFNGIIMIKTPKAGNVLPQQIANNSTNIGISELLHLQLKFFEDISGVNGAIQGKPGYSGMSGKFIQPTGTKRRDLVVRFARHLLRIYQRRSI